MGLASKPVVLVILGAYYTPRSLAAFSKLLQDAGYDVVCPSLPTCGDHQRPPTATTQDDAHVIKNAAKELISKGRRIFVLAHSYGAIVANFALTPDLIAQGDGAGIIHLTYLAGFTVLPGESMMDLLSAFGWQSEFELDTTEDGLARLKNPTTALWADINRSEAESLAPLLVTFNYLHGTSAKGTTAPWTQVATTFVMCMQDKALFPNLQESIFNRMRDYGTYCGKLQLVSIDSAHCPFETKPLKLLEVLKGVWTVGPSNNPKG